jgi:hypothetical protein
VRGHVVRERVGEIRVGGGLEDEHPSVVEVEALPAVLVGGEPPSEVREPCDCGEEAVLERVVGWRRPVPGEDGRDVAVGGGAVEDGERDLLSATTCRLRRGLEYRAPRDLHRHCHC